LAVLLVPAFSAAAPPPSSSRAVALSRAGVTEDPRWRSYVLGQDDGLVYPKHVDVVGGSSAVSNPEGLEAQGGAVTTVTSSVLQSPQLVLDLGSDVGGYVEIGITTNSGATVRLGYSEARRFLTPTGDTGNPNGPPGVPFVTDPSLGSDDDPGDRFDDFAGTGQLRSVAVRGAQRWISLQLTTPGRISIDYVRVREEHLHPSIGDYAGHFLSSDGQLNRVWYAGAYTFALDSFKDLRPGHDGGNVVVTDGAKRDRLVWLGDLVIENLLGEYALSQAPQVIRDSIQIFSCQQTSDGLISPNSQIATVCPQTPPPPTAGSGGGGVSLPEYTAWWVAALHDYDVFTADHAFVTRMLPVARRAMAYFTSHLDSNGLYSTPAGAINWHPFDNAAGEDTHTNATIYRALLALADLERRVGAGEAAARSDERQAAALGQAVLAHLWDPSAGAFWLNSSDPTANHMQDAQVEAVFDNLITGTQATSAMHFVDSHLETTYGVRNGESDPDPYMSNYISPYISSTELLARLSRHDTAGALDLMRREWGHMVDTDPNSTLWEKMAFDGDLASYSPNQSGTGTSANPDNGPGGRGITSMAHGWSGGPVPALSGYILGIRPVSAGFATWIVEPQVGDLTWAQGQAPTPHGAIVSRWQRGPADGSFVMTAGGASGTTGTVAVPLLGRDRTIARDGAIVWSAGAPAGAGAGAVRDGDYIRFPAPTGVHTFAWGNATVAKPRAACTSRRRFTISIRAPHGFRSGHGTLSVGRVRRTVRVRRSGRRLLALVDLRGRRGGPVRVRLIIRGQQGHTLGTIRTYHLCATSRTRRTNHGQRSPGRKKR
jgi:hypothetical protein